MDRVIDKEEVRVWLERYGDEVARLAGAAQAVEVGAGQLADALRFWAHCNGDRALAQGQQLLATLWSARGEGGLWDELEGTESILNIALGLCAWGQRTGDKECIEEARRLFWQSWENRQETSAQCVALSFWVALLELGSALLAEDPEREMHIVVSRCVATLLNDYYAVEAKTFYRALDCSAPEGTANASARLALQAVDALMVEAVRCGDGRLFDWGDALARRFADRGDAGEGVGDMLRLVGLRSLRHRAASWGIAWIEREWSAPSPVFEAHNTCLCLRELALLAAADQPVSGALRF